MAATKNTKAFYNTEIPSDWNISFLGELGSFSKGKGILKEQVISEGLPCIRYGEIYTTYDFKIKNFKSFISKNVAEESKEIKNGDILFAGSGETIEEIGKAVAYLGDEKAYAGGDVIILSTKKSVDAECLSYILETDFVRRQKRVLGQGNSVVHIYSSDLSKLKIPLPPLPEQKAIAACLSTWDAAISKTQALIAQKELRKKWLMQQLLSEKRIVKNEKWCKSGMKRVFLKEVAKVTMGQSPNSEDYNTDAIGLPLIQGNADLSDRKQVVRYWTIQSNKECDAGDIIMTVRAPVGAIGIANHNSSIGRGVCSIKPKGIDFWYLYHLLVFKEEHWKKLEQGSTFTAVGSKDIFHFSLFIVNSIEEQTAIAQVLQAADKEISLLKAKAEKLKEQKKGLMQVMLTGKVRLKI
jgi:type I restriction enzyme S subunit